MAELMRVMFAVVMGLGIGWGHGEEQQPSVKRIGDTMFQVGAVIFDSKSREILLPVVVNHRKGGPVEYVLVHENGKSHESILVTKARPTDLQIVLKLLKYQQGEGHVFDKLKLGDDRQVAGGQSEEAGQAVDLSIRWQEDGEARVSTINQWIIDGDTIIERGGEGKPMPEHPWHFTGSLLYEGKFMAEVEGSIIAIYLDPVALFNTATLGSDIDERWGANHLLIPEIGTKATLVIAPAKDI